MFLNGSFAKRPRVAHVCSTMGGGDWRLAVGGGWRLAVGGGWRLAVGGPLGRSLRAVLSRKKKSSSLRTPLSPPRGGGFA